MRRTGLLQKGFTLLEVAIVLLITGVLMGAMLRPFGTQLIERQRSETKMQLMRIQSSLIGYAAANGKLPCPLIDSGNPNGDCSKQHGFVPSAVLGVDGAYDEQGLLLDSWGNPVRYSVSGTDSDGDGQPDFTTVFGMQAAGMQALSPDYEICETASVCAQLRANQVPVLLLSTGPNANPRSDDEQENLDDDVRFVMRDPDQAGSDQFDDLVVWVSENSLYTHLIKAGVMP